LLTGKKLHEKRVRASKEREGFLKGWCLAAKKEEEGVWVRKWLEFGRKSKTEQKLKIFRGQPKVAVR